MNNTDFVNAISEKAKISKTDAANAMKAAIAAVTEALKKGDKVSLVGFGTLAVSEKPARSGFNPRTKETIEIPARKTIKFKPSGDLTEKIK